MIRTHLLCALTLAGFSCCSARELVHLKTGYSLQAESHVLEAGNILFQVGSGSLELPGTDVVSIEPLADSPKTAVPTRSSVTVNDSEASLRKAAEEEGIEAEFVRSVAKVESAYRQQAKSAKGAVGLMQLMPATAAELGVDATKIQENALGGAKYLRSLLLRYKGNTALALAGYNAGPGAVARFGGVPPYGETRKYIVEVTREYDRQHKLKKVNPKASAEALIDSSSRD